MTPPITVEHVREVWRARLNAHGGTHAECAKDHGLSQAHFSKFLAGDVPPGPKLLKPLGLRARIVYEVDL